MTLARASGSQPANTLTLSRHERPKTAQSRTSARSGRTAADGFDSRASPNQNVATANHFHDPFP